MAVAADVGSTNDGAALRPVLAMVNGAWADQRFPLKPLHKEKILKGIFDCEAKIVDFATQISETCGLQNLLEKLIISKPETYYFNLAPVKLDEFWLLKFKLSYEFGVSEAMEAMGTPLSIGNNPADFSEMIHNPEGAHLGGAKILQKACIEIDEKGTEAAAITTLYCPGSSSCPRKIERLSFVADHPFVFMLREARSGLVSSQELCWTRAKGFDMLMLIIRNMVLFLFLFVV
ncbi:hypothetical protein Vadar_000441 [Vaccinium darrowii]|uniref:Uncharacterized protein n=1 Tax=Vaccinium darrowii TaxID=229202 RepID=A0ACB7Y5F3_9ERIC|nr:hypothetical protein Vadar_000441 [Vaccinium darrowii]